MTRKIHFQMNGGVVYVRVGNTSFEIQTDKQLWSGEYAAVITEGGAHRYIAAPSWNELGAIIGALQWIEAHTEGEEASE